MDAGGRAWSRRAASCRRSGAAAIRGSGGSIGGHVRRGARRGDVRRAVPRPAPGCGAASARRRRRRGSTDPSFDRTRSRCASLNAPEASTSKVSSARVAVLFACWPPGPPDGEKRTSSSWRGILTLEVTTSRSSSTSRSSRRCAVPCGDGRHQARLQHGVLVGRSARRRRSKRSSKPSGSDSTRSGRRRRTAPTRSRHSPGGERARPTLKLGTAIMQMSARTPATAAMAAITLDHLSNGRFILGLGASGPAGGRGLVRRAVPEAARPNPGVRRHRAQDRRPRRAGRVPRRVLRHAAPGRCRARQGR